MNYSFYCRQSKANSKGLAPIELSIVINGKRCFINLEMKESPSNFSKLLQQKKNNYLKDYLSTIQQQINKSILEIAKEGKELTSELLREYIRYGGKRKYTLSNLFEDFNSLIVSSSIDKYLILEKEFSSFIADENEEVINISNHHIKSFYGHISSLYKASTLYGKMSKLKSIFKYAQDNGKITSNPFVGIKLHKARVEVEYLTDEEIEILKSKDYHSERLQKVLDCFLFQAGSGLSYADMASIERSDIKVYEGIRYIEKRRQKTNITFTAVLLPIAIEVLEKYDYQLPVLSNQKYNSYLKEIGVLSGIEKSLHSHLARKTYCTHLLNSGVSIEVVSKCAGHSNSRITSSTYAHLRRETILKEVSKVSEPIQ